MEDKQNSGRFKKGTSGNPNGRPKKPTHQTPAGKRRVVLQVAAKPVSITTGSGIEEVSMFEAIMLSMASNAAKGNTAAARIFLEHYTDAAGIQGKLGTIFPGVVEELSRLQIENEKLRREVPQGGVVSYEPTEEEWRTLTNAKLDAFLDFKNPR